MEAYVTAKQMAAVYSISTDQAYVIMREMEKKQRPGLLRIGRLLRARPTEFEAYLIERMKGDPQ
jgi:hypothetical protein